MDLLLNPHDTIDKLFQDRISTLTKYSNDIHELVTNFGEKDYLEQCMSNKEFSSKLPNLTKKSLGSIPQNSLIRYRGLIQDVYDIEYSCALYEETNLSTNNKRYVLSKYRDNISQISLHDKDIGIIDFDLDDPTSITLQRQSLLCVPLPGETNWSKEYFTNNSNDTIANNTNNNQCYIDMNDENNHSRKRSASDDNIEMLYDNHNNNDNKSKKKSVKFADNATNGSYKVVSNNYGLPEFINENDVCCVVKIYDVESIKMNDMIEIIGIYSMDPLFSSQYINSNQSSSEIVDDNEYDTPIFTDNFSGFSDIDTQTMLIPPSSVAPRVNVISFRRLGSSFPLLIQVNQLSMINQDTISEYSIISKSDGVFSNIITSPEFSTDDYIRIRKNILSLISLALNGDEITSEYVLLSILSRIHTRQDTTVLGYLPINITGLIEDDDRLLALQEVIKTIVPRCLAIDADINALNNTSLLPTRDYEKNIVTSSPLQLGAGTVLLINETKLVEGNLTMQGTKSMHSLRTICSTQNLPISFSYCEIKIPTDLSFIFFSRNSSSSLFSGSDVIRIITTNNNKAPNDIDIENFSSVTYINTSNNHTVHEDMELEIINNDEVDENNNILMDNDNISLSIPSFTVDEYDEIRLWWSVVRQFDAIMDPSMIKLAEDDFVLSRQENNDLSPNTFHTWLTVSRLMAFSYGSNTIEPYHWKRMKYFEMIRLNLLKNEKK